MELFTTAGTKISLLHRQLAAGEADALLLLELLITFSKPSPPMCLQWHGQGCVYFPGQSQHLRTCSEGLSEHKLEALAYGLLR